MAIQVREKPYDWQDGSCTLRANGYDERDPAHLVQVLQGAPGHRRGAPTRARGPAHLLPPALPRGGGARPHARRRQAQEGPLAPEGFCI